MIEDRCSRGSPISQVKPFPRSRESSSRTESCEIVEKRAHYQWKTSRLKISQVSFIYLKKVWIDLIYFFVQRVSSISLIRSICRSTLQTLSCSHSLVCPRSGNQVRLKTQRVITSGRTQCARGRIKNETWDLVISSGEGVTWDKAAGVKPIFFKCRARIIIFFSSFFAYSLLLTAPC